MSDPIKPCILITAFEPFDGRSRNASAEAVKRLANSLIPSELAVIIRLLPVKTYEAADLLRAAINEIQPDIVISLGEAKRDAISLETTGYNERKFTIPDNAGQTFNGEPINSQGAASYQSTLPYEAMLQAMEQVSIPVRLSADAGRYLCNEVLYSALEHIHLNQLPIRAGFIHVPHLPEAATTPDYPSMATDDVVKALLAMLEVVAQSVAKTA